MKKVFSLVLIAMTVSLALVSCGGGGSATPVDMETKLQTYFQKGDFEKAINYTIEISMPNESTEMMKSMGSMFAEKMKQAMDEKGGMKDFKVTEVSNDGATAELKIDVTFGDGTTEEQTAKYTMVDGKWKKAE